MSVRELIANFFEGIIALICAFFEAGLWPIILFATLLFIGLSWATVQLDDTEQSPPVEEIRGCQCMPTPTGEE